MFTRYRLPDPPEAYMKVRKKRVQVPVSEIAVSYPTLNQRFIFWWPCIVLWFLVNDQIDAQFFSMCLFQFSTCFEQPRAHHQENQLYQCNIWYMSLCVGDHFVCRPGHETVTDTKWHIPAGANLGLGRLGSCLGR